MLASPSRHACTIVTNQETLELAVPADATLRAMAEAVAECLTARGQTMVTAESCTGGWVAKTLTDIAGSSSWFECGVVAYSYEAKESLLGVQPQTLERTGAVSQETVVEMVSGALARYGASVAVAVTGIAGPSRRHAGQAGRHRVDRLEAAWRLRARRAVPFRRRSRSRAAPDRRRGARRRAPHSYELKRFLKIARRDRCGIILFDMYPFEPAAS